MNKQASEQTNELKPGKMGRIPGKALNGEMAEKYNFSGDPTDIKIMELQESYGIVQLNTNLYDDLLDDGHVLTYLSVYNRNSSGNRTPSMVGSFVKVNNRTPQELIISPLKIKSRCDFLTLLGELQQVESSYPKIPTDLFYVNKMTTERRNNIFSWQRFSLPGKNGKSTSKVILTHMNGIPVSHLLKGIRTGLDRALGKVTMHGFCSISKKKIESVACAGYDK